MNRLIESGVRDFPPCVLGWTFWIGSSEVAPHVYINIYTKQRA